jgi:hypothetical protein
MAMSSFSKSSAATICAHADQGAGFKACCMKSGGYDGANRNYYFQGVGGCGLTKVIPGRRYAANPESISEYANGCRVGLGAGAPCPPFVQ